MLEQFDDGPENIRLPHRLILPVPPNLAETFGYPSDARFVAFSHEPFGDETYFDDGRISGTGNWQAFKLYREHPSVAPILEPFDLRSSDKASTDGLIVDRKENWVTVLPWKEARSFLQSQHPPLTEPPADTAIPQDDVSKAVKQLLQTHRSPTPQDVLRILEEKRHAETALRAWLDQHLPQTE